MCLAVLAVLAYGWLLDPSLMMLPILGAAIVLLAGATAVLLHRWPGTRLRHLSTLIVVAYILLPLTGWPFRLAAPFWARPLALAAHMLPSSGAGALSQPVRIWPFTLTRGYRDKSGSVYVAFAESGNHFASLRGSGEFNCPCWTVHLTPRRMIISDAKHG